MSFVGRIALYLLIFLLIYSIYQDLTSGTNIEITQNERNLNSNPVIEDIQKNTEENYTIIKVRAQVGDTVLTLNEKLNDFDTVNIDEMMVIFNNLNPKSDPYNLIPGEFYYFPIFTTFSSPR